MLGSDALYHLPILSPSESAFWSSWKEKEEEQKERQIEWVKTRSIDVMQKKTSYIQTGHPFDDYSDPFAVGFLINPNNRGLDIFFFIDIKKSTQQICPCFSAV